ncbi:MAG: signal peptidase I [Candidatus Omnitrophica bacterium]|nr:signal peptidase I [Candidatus Omnitrophota bacterium]
MSTPTRDRRSFFNWRFVKGERRRLTKRWALILILSIPLFFLLERYVMTTGLVTDVSMLPILREGHYFLIDKISLRLSGLKRGDIVVLRQPKNQRWRYVKRVIGLGGETLSIAGGRVWINGKPLEEPYALGSTFPDRKPFLIEKNQIFVLGDNRENSQDSRFFGSVPLEQIEGKI